MNSEEDCSGIFLHKKSRNISDAAFEKYFFIYCFFDPMSVRNPVWL